MACPACFHAGSYYKIGEAWTDATKCKNYTCVKVANPCYPQRESAQITVQTPVCQACPAGYKTQANNKKCCPDCIPTNEIPEVCKVQNYPSQKLEQTSVEHGRCVSDKLYKVTGCSGICGSSVKAALGTGMLTPECKCCQPTNVQKHNVTLRCDKDNSVIQTTFYEIRSCSCQKTTCSSSFNMNNVNVQNDDIGTKPSLFNTDISEMDDETLQRHRRSLLNDLALIHSKKKKR